MSVRKNSKIIRQKVPIGIDAFTSEEKQRKKHPHPDHHSEQCLKTKSSKKMSLKDTKYNYQDPYSYS